MTQPPELPRTPAEVKTWVESLSADQISGLAESIASGQLFAGLGVGAEQVFDRRNPMIDLPDPPAEPVLLTVRISLRGSKPEVWRRLTIPGDLDLGRVHDAIQQAMGWTESHLHRFSLGDPYSGPHFITSFDLEEGEEGTLETDARLDQVLRAPGDKIIYEYDFGDGWTHTLKLESVAPLPDAATTAASGGAGASPAAYPLVCLAGSRACPPEDVGGIGGYADVAAWARAGADDNHTLRNGLTGAEMREWLPDGWHPDHFDLEETNAALARLAPRDLAAALAQLPSELVHVIGRLSTPARFEIDDWLAAPGWGEPDRFSREEARVLTTPFRVVLDAVGDGVRLTAAGYLPPRVVEQIFVETRLDRRWIGKGNREDLTPPVYDLRERVRRFGLVRKVKGQLVPTSNGRRLRADPEALLELVLTRLALEGEESERTAGGLVLTAVAGGAPFTMTRWGGETADEVYDAVELAMSIAGWRRGDGDYLERSDAKWSARRFTDAMAEMVSWAEGNPRQQADLARRVSLAVLRRMR